jgi:hypothetical protein
MAACSPTSLAVARAATAFVFEADAFLSIRPFSLANPVAA